MNYSEEKMDQVFLTSMAAARGTALHEYAQQAIKLGMKQRSNGQTVNIYINDAIGFRMTPEQPLYYSENCFGTVDAISYRRGKLRIHDLKTGSQPTSVHQLEVYTALFCLEYLVKPSDIEMELRIYQNNDIQIFDPSPDTIFHVMDQIITLDRRIKTLKLETMS